MRRIGPLLYLKGFLALIIHIITIPASYGQEDTLQLKGIQNDIFLHPADAFTAYTLGKNEFVYNQSPFTLPMPSWAWWGITDKITAEIDLLPLLGGFFQEPYLPVPSLNFRFKLRDQRRWVPSIAFEIMYQHLWKKQNQSDEKNLRVERGTGNSGFSHFNFSWYDGKKLRFHASCGLTYTENLLIENKDPQKYQGQTFDQTVNPDLSLSLDWRPKPWLSVHATTSYGTTFVYLDNIPRKYQASYGFRVAPFLRSKIGFLNKMRAELIGFYIYLPDAGEAIQSIVPLFPYFYWQWTHHKSKSRNRKQRNI